jgi:hypothetical protein
MITSEARDILISAYDKDTGIYYHEFPKRDTDFIDGMAWNSLALAAAKIRNDQELINLSFRYLTMLTKVGPTPLAARNYATKQVNDKWLPSSIDGYWYYPKEQAFAGPAGVIFANSLGGVQVDIPTDATTRNAKLMTAVGFLFGIVAKWSENIRSSLNSMFTAHLILGKRPASTMLWACEENPFFSYIAKKKCSVPYPPTTRYTAPEESIEKSVVPLANAEPSAWVFRRDPFKRYLPGGDPVDKQYVPIWQVVGDYLQASIV